MKTFWTVAAFAGVALIAVLSVKTGFMKGMMMEGPAMNQGEYPPAIDPAQLPDSDAPGGALLQQYCSQCHNLPGPGLHTAAQWPEVVDRMVADMKADENRGMMMRQVRTPTARETALIVDYLQEHAQKTPAMPDSTEKIANPEEENFSSVCARCHPLPDPRRHAAQEWPRIVERMKGYMRNSGRPLPPEAEFQGIISYLQRQSRNGE